MGFFEKVFAPVVTIVEVGSSLISSATGRVDHPPQPSDGYPYVAERTLKENTVSGYPGSYEDDDDD